MPRDAARLGTYQRRKPLKAPENFSAGGHTLTAFRARSQDTGEGQVPFQDSRSPCELRISTHYKRVWQDDLTVERLPGSAKDLVIGLLESTSLTP